jgi:putative DNA primase/helicase
MIPQSLMERKQWILWKYKDVNGRKTKVPYSYMGYKASVTNPDDWTDYETIIKYTGYDGVGFCFTENDPYIGIDFDHCVTGDVISSEVYEEVMALETYAEFSPSGTGIHAICRGILPPCKHRANDREIYKSGRFFTMTGNHLRGTPLEVNAAPAIAIDMVINKIDPPGMKSFKPVEFDEIGEWTEEEAKNIVKYLSIRPKFVKLVRGDWAGYKSQSEADYALCSMLAEYTTSPALIKYIFNKTRLYRQKFDGAYGKLTINSALTARLMKEILEEL